LLAFTAYGQQSSAETVASLQSRYDQDKAGLGELLSSMGNSPRQLSEGSTASVLTNLQSELDILNNRVDGTRSIIETKIKALQNNQGLSPADKNALLSELNRQLAPINELRKSILSLRGVVNGLVSDQIPKWQQSYQSYSDIMGAEAAKENLRKSVKEFANTSLGKPVADTSRQKH